MAADLILAIDQGTTSSRVMILDRKLQVRGQAQAEFPQIYPKPGWVEHDPEEIWSSVLKCMKAALLRAKCRPKDIACVGITNQRETTVLWDRETGVPVGNAIVWQCRRTTEICQRLRKQGYEAMFVNKTGLVLDPYFSGTKVKWFMDNHPGLKTKAQAGKIAFGTIDSFIVNRLTGGKVHVTDVSNASRTLLMDIRAVKWDAELTEILDCPREMLPEIRSSAEPFGVTYGMKLIPDGIPITGIAGDQQAALFGQACFERGTAKCTYGTGSFLLMNTGDIPVFSQKKLITTIAWKLGRADVHYALEGSAFVAGAAVQWLRDGLKVIKESKDIETLATQCEDSGEVVFVPALAGLGAPWWRPEARGIFTGLTRSTTLPQMARAVLEGIALQQLDLVKAMEEDTGLKLRTLKVDGGASQNDLLMQFQSDVLGVKLIRPKMIDTTVLGAALLAGVGVGLWKGVDDIKRVWVTDRDFKPSMSDGKVREYIARWEKAVARA
jgi:glycerol kinase